MTESYTSFLIIFLLMVILVFAISIAEPMMITGNIHNIVNGYSRDIEQMGGMTPQIYTEMLDELYNISDKIISVAIVCPSGVANGERIVVDVSVQYNRTSYNGSQFLNNVQTKNVKIHFTSEIGRGY